MKKISIPDPCTENWEHMSPQEKGRFCSACNKQVIDFTKKQPQKIEQIISDRKDEKICGRFYDGQLEKFNTSARLKEKLFRYIPSVLQNHRAVSGLFSLILTVTGCSEPEKKCTPVMGEYGAETDEVPVNNQFVMGKIDASAVKNDSVTGINKSDSAFVKRN